MLTPTQLSALKADIIAATDQAMVDMEAAPTDGDLAFAVALLYNQPAAVDFYGNYRNVPADAVMNAVTWKNFTPTDSVPANNTADALLIYQARTLLAQSYQFNLQTILVGRSAVDATKASTVSGLKDCLNTNLPTGTNGAGQKCGWNAVQPILCRKATRVEKLLANIAGGAGDTSTTAATFTHEGPVNDSDILAAMATT